MSHVNISLSVNTVNYVQRLKDAKTQTDRNLILMEKRIDQFAKDVNNNFTSVDGAINTMLTGLSKLRGGGYVAAILALSVALVSTASGVHQLSKAALENEKALKKASERAKMSVDEFRTLSMVTNTVGIDMDKMSDISKDVFDKLGDYVTAGSGGFKDFFDVVGTGSKVTAEELQNLSSDEVLAKVVSEMERVGATGAQMTFVLESIANDASDLLPLLKNNAKAMEEMRSRMDAIAHTGMIDPDVVLEMQVLDENWNTMWTNMGTVAANKMEGVYTMLNSLIGRMNEYLVSVDLDKAAEKIQHANRRAMNGLGGGELYKAKTDSNLMEQEQEVLRVKRAIEMINEVIERSRAMAGDSYNDENERKQIKHLEEQLALYEVSIKKQKELDKSKLESEKQALKLKQSRTKQLESAGYASDAAIGDIDKAKAIEAARLIEIAQMETTEDIKAKLIAKAHHDREAAELAHYTKLAQIQLDAANTEQERIHAQNVLSNAQLAERQHNEQLSAEAIAGIKLNNERAMFEELQNLRIEQAVTDSERVAVEREVAQEMLQYDYENKLISHSEYLARKNEMDLQANEANARMNSLVIQGAQDVFSQLENISKEGSSAQKIMFAANKALAIANAAIMMESNAVNAKNAVLTAGVGDPTAPARAEMAATMSRISDSIRIGMMVGTTIGQFHSGTDEVDQTGSYILQSGERVIQRAANKDLTEYLNSNKSGSGQVKVDAPLIIEGDTTISESKLTAMMAKQRSEIAKLVKVAQRENPSLR
ncbi:hypothetical protein C2F72_RS01380 [Vibrio parahaemolyticus]|nr:hypothetical protein [Vibrio parahaemolyticus]